MSAKILIVDDSPDLRTLLSRFLQRRGFTTEEAGNGRLALDYLTTHSPPDLILLDSEMDIMNGREFLDHLKVNPIPQFIPPPIIALSGASPFAHPLISKSMRKPVDLSKLEVAIQALITK